MKNDASKHGHAKQTTADGMPPEAKETIRKLAEERTNKLHELHQRSQETLTDPKELLALDNPNTVELLPPLEGMQPEGSSEFASFAESTPYSSSDLYGLWYARAEVILRLLLSNRPVRIFNDSSVTMFVMWVRRATQEFFRGHDDDNELIRTLAADAAQQCCQIYDSPPSTSDSSDPSWCEWIGQPTANSSDASKAFQAALSMLVINVLAKRVNGQDIWAAVSLARFHPFIETFKPVVSWYFDWKAGGVSEFMVSTQSPLYHLGDAPGQSNEWALRDEFILKRRQVESNCMQTFTTLTAMAAVMDKAVQNGQLPAGIDMNAQGYFTDDILLLLTCIKYGNLAIQYKRWY